LVDLPQTISRPYRKYFRYYYSNILRILPGILPRALLPLSRDNCWTFAATLPRALLETYRELCLIFAAHLPRNFCTLPRDC
jgi:hypothetical protein